MPYVIRTARDADVSSIVSAELGSGRASASTAERFASAVAAAISDPTRLVLVAEARGERAAVDGSAVVGWAKTHYWNYADGPAQSGHYLGGITVTPRCRRQGLASRLTEARLDWIWARAEDAWYVVNARNAASLALHRRWGFREVARGPRFHTVTFDGGEGLLLQAARPAS